MHVAWVHRGTPLSWLDALASALFLALLILETIADEQMWSFQRDKKRRQAAGDVVDPPFFTEGLYRYSRHPNYFGEIGQWWVFVLFAVSAGGTWLTWTWSGAAFLTALFAGSIAFTESISASRYDAYADYQRSTSTLIPWFTRTRARPVSDG